MDADQDSARSVCVFVYGTLRHGEINDIACAAARFGCAGLPAPRLIGSGRVPGRLVDFGAWPGLIPEPVPDTTPAPMPTPTRMSASQATEPAISAASSSGSSASSARRWVSGDIFLVDPALLPILDEIEGIRPDGREAFYRSVIDVEPATLSTSVASSTSFPTIASVGVSAFGAVPEPLPAGVTKAIRCCFYPIDVDAGHGLVEITGGDWITYRRARGTT